MFKLRREQIDAIRAMEQGEFERRVVTHVRDNLPREIWERVKPSLKEKVRSAKTMAAEFNLTNEYGIVCVLDVQLLLGDDFASQYEMLANVLNDAEAEPDLKASDLLSRAQEVYAASHEGFESFEAEDFLD